MCVSKSQRFTHINERVARKKVFKEKSWGGEGRGGRRGGGDDFHIIGAERGNFGRAERSGAGKLNSWSGVERSGAEWSGATTKFSGAWSGKTGRSARIL